MSITAELHPTEQVEHDAREEYNRTIEPFRSSLWNYCLSITGSSWDADDLVQETLTKTYLLMDKHGLAKAA
jgi:DNA-directed RNA polymerase specialized sigma24 family protein